MLGVWIECCYECCYSVSSFWLFKCPWGVLFLCPWQDRVLHLLPVLSWVEHEYFAISTSSVWHFIHVLCCFVAVCRSSGKNQIMSVCLSVRLALSCVCFFVWLSGCPSVHLSLSLYLCLFLRQLKFIMWRRIEIWAGFKTHVEWFYGSANGALNNIPAKTTN